jgi:glycosyltransferase involved in cell wall biosynthesis
MPRILFVAAHRPNRSPSQRFRFEQYLTALEENGFKCDFSWLVDEHDDEFLYRSGHYMRKFLFLRKSYKIRRKNVAEIGNYNIVFVQREALMFRSLRFEKLFSRKSKFIFDFDDAIWLMDVSRGNRHWRWLKNPAKTRHIIKHAHLVFAGNKFLSAYAKSFNKNVTIVPTTIDTQYHKRKHFINNKERVCIGWTGSITTIKHLREAESFLASLKLKYGEKIYFKVIGSDSYQSEALEVKGIKWNIESEIEDLEEIDIGIMPLPDNEWAKGKCGFKGLQYMALEIPTVMSPVGVNTEIIQDGVNGFLASSEEEWVEKISLLVESPELRERLGKKGRTTVVEKYSVDAWKDTYVKYFNDLLNG